MGLPHSTSRAEWLVAGCSPIPLPQPPQPLLSAKKVTPGPRLETRPGLFSRWPGWALGVALVSLLEVTGWGFHTLSGHYSAFGDIWDQTKVFLAGCISEGRPPFSVTRGARLGNWGLFLTSEKQKKRKETKKRNCVVKFDVL